MNQLADFDRLSAVGAWINTLPVYMAPMHHEEFIEMVKQVMDQTPPEALVRFLAREATH